jgi:ATP-dependent Clp protease ATP-binding subunit ClpA
MKDIANPGPTPRARQTLEKAQMIAKEFDESPKAKHVLLAILTAESGCALNMLSKLHPELPSILKNLLGPKSPSETSQNKKDENALDEIFQGAQSEAKALQHAYVGSEHLFLASFQKEAPIEDFCKTYGFDLDFFREAILHELDPNHPKPKPPKAAQAPENPSKKPELSLSQHEKLAQNAPEIRAVQDFLAWLDENKILLCQIGPEGYSPILKSADKIVYSYFEIDDTELENERRALLAAQRQANQE